MRGLQKKKQKRKGGRGGRGQGDGKFPLTMNGWAAGMWLHSALSPSAFLRGMSVCMIDAI